MAPLYGPLPDLDPAWAILAPDSSVIFAAEDVRELIRDIEGIPLNYRELHKLSSAMNAVYALSPAAIERIKADVRTHTELTLQIESIKQANPGTSSGLPLIKADVVEYSEEPLKHGATPLSLKLQPLNEEVARLAVKICLALDFESFDLAGPCCTADRFSSGITPLYRS